MLFNMFCTCFLLCALNVFFVNVAAFKARRCHSWNDYDRAFSGEGEDLVA